MALAAVQCSYPRLYVSQFDLNVPVARPKGSKTLYFPIDWWCEWLGVDKRGQVRVLRADSRMVPDLVLRELHFNLSGGFRCHLAIRRQECALWISGIDPLRCKPEVQGKIKEVQAAVMAEADRILFGGPTSAPTSARGILSATEREVIRMACLDCGLVHTITREDGEMTIVRGASATEL